METCMSSADANKTKPTRGGYRPGAGAPKGNQNANKGVERKKLGVSLETNDYEKLQQIADDSGESLHAAASRLLRDAIYAK
jgi:hypothetical protein